MPNTTSELLPAEEYLIKFDTRINPGKIEAVRVRLDIVQIEDMDEPFRIDLAAHPLYSDLVQYMEINKKG